MSAARQDLTRIPRSPARTEMERRLALAGDELQRARCRLPHNHEAVRAAEEALMACRLAWEETALRVAELADVGREVAARLGRPGLHLDAGIAETVS